MIRIARATPLDNLHILLTLTNGDVVERDLHSVLSAPIYAPIRNDPKLFSQVTVEAGTLAWPIGLDVCPDMVIWAGPPPTEPVNTLELLTATP